MEAMDLAMSGSRSKVGALGIESLMNRGAVDRFFQGEKHPGGLPRLFVTGGLGRVDEAGPEFKVNCLALWGTNPAGHFCEGTESPSVIAPHEQNVAPLVPRTAHRSHR
jgi:hypothetical protein